MANYVDQRMSALFGRTELWNLTDRLVYGFYWRYYVYRLSYSYLLPILKLFSKHIYFALQTYITAKWSYWSVINAFPLMLNTNNPIEIYLRSFFMKRPFQVLRVIRTNGKFTFVCRSTAKTIEIVWGFYYFFFVQLNGPLQRKHNWILHAC